MAATRASTEPPHTHAHSMPSMAATRYTRSSVPDMPCTLPACCCPAPVASTCPPAQCLHAVHTPPPPRGRRHTLPPPPPPPPPPAPSSPPSTQVRRETKSVIRESTRGCLGPRRERRCPYPYPGPKLAPTTEKLVAVPGCLRKGAGVVLSLSLHLSPTGTLRGGTRSLQLRRGRHCGATPAAAAAAHACLLARALHVLRREERRVVHPPGGVHVLAALCVHLGV